MPSWSSMRIIAGTLYVLLACCALAGSPRAAEIQAKEKKKPGTLAKAFSTHPQTPDRISKSQEEIARILPARQQYVVTTSEFDNVKARLAALENRRKVIDQKDSNKPSLRRTSSPSKSSGKDDSGDDRPTLKRREDQKD